VRSPWRRREAEKDRAEEKWIRTDEDREWLRARVREEAEAA
jgi:hypothetical protein